MSDVGVLVIGVAAFTLGFVLGMMFANRVPR